MSLRHTLSILFSISALMATAQAPFSKWIVQSGDSVNNTTPSNSRMPFLPLTSGELLYCACRSPSFVDRCRFTRLSTDGDPLGQWEIQAPSLINNSFQIHQVIELADGSFACFGHYDYWALYMRIAQDGTILTAKSYSVVGIGILAPIHWNDAVQDAAGHFVVAGQWGGASPTGMISRIALDGTLLGSGFIDIGSASYTFFHSLVRLPDGDIVFHGSSNFLGNHASTYLFRTDSLLSPEWARAYPDSGYSYSISRVFRLDDGSYRMVLRTLDPNNIYAPLVVAAAADGTPMWGRRRIPPASYPNMIVFANSPQMVGDTIVLVGDAWSGNQEFVELLDTDGDELLMGEVEMPSPVASASLSAAQLHIAGYDQGPLGSGSRSLGITRLDFDLAHCGTIYHSTGSSMWVPGMDTTWSLVTAPVTVTDVLTEFLSYPTTAYSQMICTSTGISIENEPAPVILPNPASDRINIRSEGIETVEIIDATGRVMIARSLRGEGSVAIELSSFASGIYHVRIETMDGWRSEKVIKE